MYEHYSENMLYAYICYNKCYSTKTFFPKFFPLKYLVTSNSNSQLFSLAISRKLIMITPWQPQKTEKKNFS